MAHGGARPSGAVPKTSKYRVSISGFDPREEPAAKYPEDGNFLRFWHPCYVDFVDIPAAVMRKARGKGAGTMIVEFVEPRKSLRASSHVEMPASATFGVNMYCRTRNSSGQLCIKPNGIVNPIIPMWDVIKTGDYRRNNVKIISMQTAVELRNESHAVKGTIRPLTIEKMRSSDFMYKELESSNRLMQNYELFASAMKRIVQDSYKPAFLSLNHAYPPKVRGYFSPQYMTNGGDVLPTSSYMIRTCMEDATMPDSAELQRAFDICLEQHPEMEGVGEFRRVASAYLNSFTKDPSKGDADLRRKWFTCMEIAIGMTCVYNNAVPYLMDMEHVGVTPLHNLRSNAINPHAELGRRSKDWVEVERMMDAEKDYGHDCEDSAMNADLRKRALNPDRLHAEGLWSEISDELRLIALIYELFVSCVVQMFCGGNDAQTEKDDGIFHFCSMFIPRAYYARMEFNGRVPAAKRMPLPQTMRPWEREYKVGYDKNGKTYGHIAVMYGEGTNTVCPSQFAYDPVVEQGRADVQSFLRMHGQGLGPIEEWVNIYHANVYATNRAHLSSFYKQALSCIVGDGAHHREEGIYDYMFSMQGRLGSYGVPVEAMAIGDDRVALKAIMTYKQTEIEAIETVLAFRAQTYGAYEPSSPMQRRLAAPALPLVCGRDFTDGLVGVPDFDASTPVNRYRYVRFAPVMVDLITPSAEDRFGRRLESRKEKLTRIVRSMIANAKMQITAVKVYGRPLKAVPMDPISGTGETALWVIDVFVFFEPTLIDKVSETFKRMFTG